MTDERAPGARERAPGEFRCLRPEEREAFEHLQRRGYASGHGTLHAAAARRLETGPPAAEQVTDDGARGYFVGGRAVAGAYVKRYQTWWGADELPMESVGGVVALPEARRRGYTAQLMAGLVGDMRARGVAISTITSPFSYAFYRRMGWEYAFQRVEAEFEPALVAPLAEGARGMARFVQCAPEGDAVPEDLDRVYRQVMRARYQGAAARPAGLWREHLRGERTYAYVWDGPEGPAGYTILSVKRDDVLQVRELFAVDRPALSGLFGLLADFDSQAKKVQWNMPADMRLDLAVPEQGDLAMRWQAEGMFRIVDLAAALAARTYGDTAGHVSLRLMDRQAPWNRGPFDVTWSGGRAEARPARGGAAPEDGAVMEQRTFAQIYSGAITPEEAVRLRGAEIGAAARRVLTSAFVTGRPPLLLEWF